MDDRFQAWNYTRFRCQYQRAKFPTKYEAFARNADSLIQEEHERWLRKASHERSRLAFGAILAERYRGDPRETEELALARCYGFPVLDCDLLIETLNVREAVWFCEQCKCKKPVNAFDRNRRNPAGLAFWCKDCAGKFASSKFKKAA